MGKVHRVVKFNQNAWIKRYIDMNADLKKKQKLVLKKIFLSRWIMEFLRRMWENIGILNLSQQKEKIIISYQSQIIILQSFSHKISYSSSCYNFFHKYVCIALITYSWLLHCSFKFKLAICEISSMFIITYFNSVFLF